MGYRFTTQWVKGALNQAPDALSRYPVSDPQPTELLAEYDSDNNSELTLAEIRAVASEHQESTRIQDLRQCAEKDQVYQQLQHYVLHGFPDHRHQLPDECRRYWNIRSQLAMDDGLVTYGCRLLIPHSMRRGVLAQLHEAHQGSVRTKQRARLTVYWPGIDSDIDNLILACKHCQDGLPSHAREPLLPKSRPERPFQEVAGDFCSHAAHDFLILVDCYSDWPEIIAMGHSTTAPRLAMALKKSFCHTGVPDIFWSDQGPCTALF